jgi:VCBS repeat-containing protein
VNGSIIVKNLTAFTGGQDGQNYTFIQQSDVNAIVGGLSGNLKTQAQNGLKAQLKPNEQLINQIQCKAPDVKSDHHIGSDTGGASVTSATLTISETCTGLAYDQVGSQNLVKSLLATSATSDLGSGYKQVGDIVVDTTVQNVANDNSGATLLMNAKGMWVYDLSSNQLQQHLLALIAGRKVTDAENILKAQKGISNAKITISGGGDTLPPDVSQIKLDIAPVAGLKATGGTSAVVPTVTGGGNAANGSNVDNGARGLIPGAVAKG